MSEPIIKYGTATAARAPIALAVFLISCFIEAEAADEVWGWFLYDWTGPTVGQWFGIAILAALIVRRVHAMPSVPEPYALGAGGEPKAVGDMLSYAVVTWASLGALLVLARVAGFLFHWVQS